MQSSMNEWYLPHRIKFFISIILQIPTIFLCLLIFTFFILQQRILHKLQHQALLLLFIINFIQLILNTPMSIDFFRLDRVNPPTREYCKWWGFIESTLDAANEFLVTTIAVQRHILIFQLHILNVRRTRYLLYYLPLLLSIIYPIIFYMIVIVFYPCDDSKWDFTSDMCGDNTCFLSDNEFLGAYDWIMNTAVPMVIIILSNIALIIRIIKQKHQRQQAIRWSNQRRMTLQLFSISSLYLITWLPCIIVGLIQQIESSSYLSEIQQDYISDLPHLICLLLPWMSIRLLPELKEWMLKQFQHLKRKCNIIRPA